MDENSNDSPKNIPDDDRTKTSSGLHSLPFENIRKIVTILIIVLIVASIVLWFFYKDNQEKTSTDQEPKVATVWGYLESETFRILLVSIAIPIFIFLFESKFKTFESYTSSIKERVREGIAERREKRLQIIEHATKMWQNLFGMVIELASFDYKDKDGKASLRDLLLRIQKFPPEADEVISELMHAFPILDSDEDIQALVDWVNILWEPTITVGNYIQDDLDVGKTGDILPLQLSLNVIRGFVRSTYYYHFTEMLKLGSLKLTLIEDKMMDEGINLSMSETEITLVIDRYLSKDEKEKIGSYENGIKIRREANKNNIKKIKNEIKNHLADITNVDEIIITKEQLDAYKRAFEALKARITQDGTQHLLGLDKTEDWENSWRAYNTIALNAHMKSFRYIFTKEGIMKFAAWCDHRMKVQEIIQERQEAEQKKQEQTQTA